MKARGAICLSGLVISSLFIAGVAFANHDFTITNNSVWNNGLLVDMNINLQQDINSPTIGHFTSTGGPAADCTGQSCSLMGGATNSFVDVTWTKDINGASSGTVALSFFQNGNNVGVCFVNYNDIGGPGSTDNFSEGRPCTIPAGYSLNLDHEITFSNASSPAKS